MCECNNIIRITSLAITDADAGEASIKESSPKTSPSPINAKVVPAALLDSTLHVPEIT